MSENFIAGEERGALEACLAQARLLLVEREFGAAQQALRQALVLDPTQAGTLNLCGVALEMQGCHEDAGRYYRAALAFQPDCAEARGNLVRVTCWPYRPDGIERNLEPQEQ
jgi:Flp pilus assembly protein TadD